MLIFALLPNKTETTYVNFYNALKTLNESLNPKSIMVDFEKAAINAIQSVFTNTSVRGCFFHLSQSIWRRLQNLGFQKRYMEDSEFALQIRMMAALSFVPEQDVENAWNELLDSEFYSLNEEILTPLTNYFEDTWIGRLDRRNRRKPALFTNGKAPGVDEIVSECLKKGGPCLLDQLLKLINIIWEQEEIPESW
ncbi:uncharacterized protein LOC132953747 [Metopolophium dirhodum]|uniref:uncharacterized protein LOC132953747 n=1 Tax=Metopolophium dirhodum TaxID=44670 RepID=UPI0029904897|nr:uncharacterized protein LOC132953747 [Metopolophium dirhodum]